MLSESGLPVSGLVTLGSPLNLLRPEGFRFGFPWRNFHYPQDPVCLGRGLDATRFPGVRNYSLGSHEGFVVSHTSYWTSSVVAAAVFRMSVGGI